MQADRGWPDSTTDPWELAILQDRGIEMVRENGSWFLYRPTHIVVDPQALDARHSRNRYEATQKRRALDLLNKHGATPVLRSHREPARADGERRGPRTVVDDAVAAQRLGLELWTTHGRDKGLPEVVRQMRTLAPESASLNHVQVCDQHRIGGCGPADPADAPQDVPGRSDAGSGLRIGVIDTGIDESLKLATAGPADAEIPDSDADLVLDPAAGHGTFVTGIIRGLAPGAEVYVHRAMFGPAGVASDLEVADALLSMPEVDILNLSFGGASQDDAAPLVIARALAQLSPKTVVVAAAGNQDETRPHWPGAFKRVYAIGSVEQDEKTGAWERASYSNRGWWVDASAPGSDVTSTFVSFQEQAGAAPRTFKGGATWSGTSFATPKVVAAIAALASSEGISASEAAYRLIDSPSVDRLPELGALVAI